MRQEKNLHNDQLRKLGTLEEKPFQSTVPLIGSFIASFRTFWNSIGAKWAYRQLIRQQNEFNEQVIQRLSELENQVYQQMIEQDKEQTHLLRETAELQTTLNQVNRLLLNVEQRIIKLEQNGDNDQEEK